MNQVYGITQVVHIRNQSIYLNDACVFTDKSDSDDFLINAYKHLGIAYPKFYKMDTLSKYGFIAAEYLMKGKKTGQHSPYRQGIILQNHSSSLDTDRKYQESIADIASPALFVYTLPNIVMGELAIRHTLKGENTFFVADAFNANELSSYVQILTSTEILSQVIIGYIELDEGKPDIFFCLIEQGGDVQMNAAILQALYAKHPSVMGTI